MNYQVHPSATVDEGALIGEGSRIWHFTHISAGARIGKGVSMRQNVYIGNKVVVGDNCKIQNNVSVYDNVTLEEAVFCGPSMVFSNVHYPRSLIERKDEFRDTLIKRGATLRANCTIICGITIGEFALKDARIPIAIHYPIPLNKQADETVTLPVGDEVAAQVISFPMHPYLSESQQIEGSQALGDDLIFSR